MVRPQSVKVLSESLSQQGGTQILLEMVTPLPLERNDRRFLRLIFFKNARIEIQDSLKDCPNSLLLRKWQCASEGQLSREQDT